MTVSKFKVIEEGERRYFFGWFATYERRLESGRLLIRMSAPTDGHWNGIELRKKSVKDRMLLGDVASRITFRISGSAQDVLQEAIVNKSKGRLHGCRVSNDRGFVRLDKGDHAFYLYPEEVTAIISMLRTPPQSQHAT